MKNALTFRAGPRALARIREAGLDAADVEIVPGAAGGPKGLGISGLDRVIFGDWLPAKPRVRDFIGASVGAWRLTAASCAHPAQVLEDLARGYSEQRFTGKPSAEFISQSSRTLLKSLFEGREAEILAHPYNHLHILAVRGRWPLPRDSRFRTPFGFGIAVLANAVGRRHLAQVLDRTVFHDARAAAPFLSGERFDAFTTHAVALDAGNLAEALVATASIPMVMQGVANVPNAPAGTYWDGGIIDYHLHLPYHRAPGLVLYPHFTDRIVPGWLDKTMPWRKAGGAWLDNVVLVAPSREYLAKLPFGKLPDRNDFKRFANDYEARMKYWRFAIGESDRLAEEFLEFSRNPDPSRLLHL